MKIIFLDIDGVLVTDWWIKNIADRDSFSPPNVAYLNRILDETDAYLVISSTWRISKTEDHLLEIFKEQGVDITGDRWLGYTPDLSQQGMSREEEIITWLEWTEDNIEDFVIIDDDRIFEELDDHHYDTNPRYGLEGRTTQQIIERFNNNQWKPLT